MLQSPSARFPLRSLVAGLVVVTLSVGWLPETAEAGSGSPSYPERISSKLGRGVGNIFLSFAEIPANTYKRSLPVWDARGSIGERNAAFFTGLFAGIGYMTMRIVTGAIDSLPPHAR